MSEFARPRKTERRAGISFGELESENDLAGLVNSCGGSFPSRRRSASASSALRLYQRRRHSCSLLQRRCTRQHHGATWIFR